MKRIKNSKKKSDKPVDLFQYALGFEESAERWSVADKPKSYRFLLKAIEAYSKLPEDREAIYNMVSDSICIIKGQNSFDSM
jgi:hypothetical protein